MPKALLFMPDYDADPIWSLDDEAMVPLEHLPLSDGARDDARAWARRWEAHTWATMEDDDDDTPEPRQLERDGRAVWERLREELAPAHRLGYATFEEDMRHVQWTPGGPVEPCPPRAED
jgi:hypothetical protein